MWISHIYVILAVSNARRSHVFCNGSCKRICDMRARMHASQNADASEVGFCFLCSFHHLISFSGQLRTAWLVLGLNLVWVPGVHTHTQYCQLRLNCLEADLVYDVVMAAVAGLCTPNCFLEPLETLPLSRTLGPIFLEIMTFHHTPMRLPSQQHTTCIRNQVVGQEFAAGKLNTCSRHLGYLMLLWSPRNETVIHCVSS